MYRVKYKIPINNIDCYQAYREAAELHCRVF